MRTFTQNPAAHRLTTPAGSTIRDRAYFSEDAKESSKAGNAHFNHDFSRIPVYAVSEQQAREDVQGRPEEDLSSHPPQDKEVPSDDGAAAETLAGTGKGHQLASTALDLQWKMPPHLRDHSRQTVKTILMPGQKPKTIIAAPAVFHHLDQPAYSAVAPGGSPAIDNSAASNDCTPSTASAVLNWSVISADATNWAVDVDSLTLAGQINIKPWPSDPNNMVVPNTPNPVDGGNINNRAGSNNHWQAVIDDMANYDTVGGGAGSNWHSTTASSAHERAHWSQDYVGDAVTGASGGNWSQTNTDLDALREPKASSANAADARTALSPRVNARLATWRSATIRRWNNLISTNDSPGSSGRGYAAGQAVLDTLISTVRTYATSKGWM